MGDTQHRPSQSKAPLCFHLNESSGATKKRTQPSLTVSSPKSQEPKPFQKNNPPQPQTEEDAAAATAPCTPVASTRTKQNTPPQIPNATRKTKKHPKPQPFQRSNSKKMMMMTHTTHPCHLLTQNAKSCYAPQQQNSPASSQPQQQATPGAKPNQPKTTATPPTPHPNP